MDKMSWFDASQTQEHERIVIVADRKQSFRYTKKTTTQRKSVLGLSALATVIGLLFLNTSNDHGGTASHEYAQAESETIEFDIPTSTLTQALQMFARQSCVEPVFVERGLDEVSTQAVIGSFPKERALEMLLAGTGLQVGYVSGDGVIVLRADTSEAAGDLDLGAEEPSIVLLVRTVADEPRCAANETGGYEVLGGHSPASTNHGLAADANGL